VGGGAPGAGVGEAVAGVGTVVEPGVLVPTTPFAPRTGVLVLRWVPGVTEPGVGETLWSGRIKGGVLALLVVLLVPPVADEPPVSVSDGKLAGGVALAGAGAGVDVDPVESLVDADWSPGLVSGKLAGDRSTGTRSGRRLLFVGALVPKGLR
jgi:hypothetical protein